MPNIELGKLKDQTLKKRMQKVFSNFHYLSESILFVLGNSYTLSLQVRDASEPSRVLWEKMGKLLYSKEHKNIYPHIDGLPITITLQDLLRSFKSDIQVSELLVFLCWFFKSGNYEAMCWLPGTENKLIIVSTDNPIKLS